MSGMSFSVEVSYPHNLYVGKLDQRRTSCKQSYSLQDKKYLINLALLRVDPS